MDIIRSGENSSFRELKKLLMKKYRDREGLFIAEGPNIVREALEFDRELVKGVFLREGSQEDMQSAGDVDKRFLSEKLFDQVADTESSQGVIAVIRKPPAKDPVKLAEKDDARFVVLDRLQDPGNIGTVIRTAEAAGVSAVIILKGTCDPFSPKVVRACTGSILRMPLLQVESEAELMELLKGAGMKTVVTEMDGDTDVFGTGFSEVARGRLAIVIGNEGSGVSDSLRSAADIRARIPMHGEIESLNAGVAAALMMYQTGPYRR